ncbi:putative fatty acyl-CoA reductase CG5065 [Drosophila pseudoobscura]|uniref:Fatty acyl-CoA reductase n=1 Tax=Drosophila pseudoobscura pseudoobscura TaxID=46245 RepID=A0A6I8VR32_DROPS|nr:putative fatty acyl-CoA reductase CG5065 [Drosophila pseudoobscura]
MYHLKSLARQGAMRQQELTTLVKALPTAALQARGYATEHQIPDRLKDVPTAKDPRFFDMVDLPLLIGLLNCACSIAFAVTAAISEPLPGWIEGVTGPTGLMIGAARGVIRSMHCNPLYSSTVIPVDKAINGLILCGYQRAKASSQEKAPSKRNEVHFCNLCISKKALTSWGDSIETGRRFFYETPLSFSLWYPGGSIKKNYYHHLFCVIFFHYLPAYFIDFLMLISGQKPFLVNVQRKVSMGLKLLQYYTTKDWEFQNEKFQEMSSQLNAIDEEMFDTSVGQLNWETYISTYIMGMRTYILRESPSTLPYARKVLRRLYILDCVSKVLFFTLTFWFLWTHMDGFVESGDAFIRSSLSSIYHERNNTIHA